MVMVVRREKSVTSASMVTDSGTSMSTGLPSLSSSSSRPRLSLRPGMARPTTMVWSPELMTLPLVTSTLLTLLLSSIAPETTAKG